MTGPAPIDHSWWLASRASGIVALVCITVSVALGLAMASRISKRPGLAKAMMGVHEHAALAGLVAIAVHAITLIGDPWLHPGPVGVVVPFVMDYRPLWTGLGIIGGWLAMLLSLSFYARKRIGVQRWRTLHRATLLVWVLSVVHTVFAGTDGQSPWMLAFMATSAAVIVPLLAMRLRRKPTARAAPRHGAPAPRAVA